MVASWGCSSRCGPTARLLVLAFALGGLAACFVAPKRAPVIVDTAPPQPPAPEPAPPTELELLVRDLDPGRMPAPADLDWGYRGGLPSERLIAELADAWQTRFVFTNSLLAWDTQGRERGTLGRLALLTIAQTQEDRESGQQCSLTCLDALMRSYAYFASMRYLDQPEIIERLIDGFGWRGELTPQRQSALETYLKLLIAESPSRLRAAAVEVLRLEPDGAYAFHALSLLSVSETQAGNYALAVRLNREVIARQADSVTAEELIAAAEACYRVPDYDCARAYIERAGAMVVPPSVDDMTVIAEKEADARGVEALAGATDYGDRLRVADLEDDLGRLGEARAHYRELTTEHPEDARAFVGLMWSETHNLGWAKLFALLADAGPENRPPAFERLALSMWFAGAFAVAREADPARRAPLLAQSLRVQAMIRELGAREAELAGALALLVDAANAAAAPDHDKLIHELADSAATQDTGNELTGRLRLILAALESDNLHASNAIADVTRKHRDQASVAAQRRSTLLQRAVLWNDAVALETLARAKTLDAVTAIDVRAIRAKPGDTKEWATIAADYQALPTVADDYEARRRANNTQVALFRAGMASEPPRPQSSGDTAAPSPRATAQGLPTPDGLFSAATPAKGVIIDRTVQARVSRDAPAFVTALAVEARAWLSAP